MGAVSAVAASADGSRIVTGGADGTARVWAGPEAATVMTLSDDPHPLGEVYWSGSAAFSLDGRYVATGEESGVVRIWDIGTRSVVAELPARSDGAVRVAFSPNGAMLAAGSLHGAVFVWDWRAGKSVAELHAPPRPDLTNPLAQAVRSLHFSPDGKLLLAAFSFLGPVIWNLDSGAAVAALSRIGESVSAAFSPDGKLVASGSQDGIVRVSDAKTGALIASLQEASTQDTSVAFSPDGNQIVSTNIDNVVRAWRWRGADAVQTFAGNTDIAEDAGFSPDGQWLVSAGRDGGARVWEAKTGYRAAELWGNAIGVALSTFSPDGTLILTVGGGIAKLNRCETCLPLDRLQALARGHLTRALTCDERTTFLHEPGSCATSTPNPATPAAAVATASVASQSPASTSVTTLAGTGKEGFADGPGGAAQLNGSGAVAVDTKGVAYVADANNNRIRRIAPDGTVSTLAGTGVPGYSDGPAASAQFNTPVGIAGDASGSIYVADFINQRIRTVVVGGH